jgi:hypothetical protein
MEPNVLSESSVNEFLSQYTGDALKRATQLLNDWQTGQLTVPDIERNIDEKSELIEEIRYLMINVQDKKYASHLQTWSFASAAKIFKHKCWDTMIYLYELAISRSTGIEHEELVESLKLLNHVSVAKL